MYCIPVVLQPLIFSQFLLYLAEFAFPLSVRHGESAPTTTRIWTAYFAFTRRGFHLEPVEFKPPQPKLIVSPPELSPEICSQWRTYGYPEVNILFNLRQQQLNQRLVTHRNGRDRWIKQVNLTSFLV